MSSNPSVSNSQQAKPKRRLSKVPFNDKLSPKFLSVEPLEVVPTSQFLRPYWLLRVLRRVILSGGYISSRIYVPKLVWSQPGVKFTGLSAKTSAFEQLLIAIKSRVFLAEPLPHDSEGLYNTVTELKHLSRDLIQIQNNLSKPLPFIREVTLAKENHASPARTSNVIEKNVLKFFLILLRLAGSPILFPPLEKMSSNTPKESARLYRPEWMMKISSVLLLSPQICARSAK